MNDIISNGFCSWAGTCLAYVGPGSGITMLWALLAVLGGILFIVFGLLFWPVRVLLRSLRKSKAGTKDGNPQKLNAETAEATDDDKQTVPSPERS